MNPLLKPTPQVRARARATAWRGVPRPLAQAMAVVLAAWSAQATAAGPAFNGAWIRQQAGQQAAADAARIGTMTQWGATLTPQQIQQINAQTRLSIANLGQVAQAAAAAAEAQRKAREAALRAAGGVPDGLGEGGLKVDTNAATAGWSGADGPTQTIDPATGRVLVGVRQTSDRAILNWETFNVGRNTSLHFDQQASWAVLNRVNDPQARPSQIQGQISGAGTVMVLNRNGVIFSGSSQVDTGNLVAAAARMSDAQFRGNGLYSTNTGSTFAPSFTDASGKLIVEAGAQLNTRAPASVTQGGGYALLLGGEVRNDGTIATPRGQAQLAAGDSFILRPGYSSDSNQVSTTRGNEVAVLRAADSVAGTVVNRGVIQAERGDITLAGHDVRQDGVALSTTSVSQRGTIHLLNSAADTSGRVTLGKGSVTAVLIEDSTDTALDSQRDALIAESKTQDEARIAGTAIPAAFDNLSRAPDRRDQSRVEVVSGGNVTFDNQSLTLATGGQIAVSAAGRAFVADGARLDVAGAPSVKVAMDGNNVKVSVQGNEQRDAPGSRDSGKLTSQDVWVDVRDLVLLPAGTGGYATDRYYTPGGLLEVGGYLGTTGHTIGEWAAVGGSVRLAGKEVVTQRGSSVNLAGGTVVTADGFMRTSWVRGSDGGFYDANTAPGDLLYEGLYNGFQVDYARWGVTDRFYNTALAPTYRWQRGYVTGRDAGRLVVDAPTAVLEGDIHANVLQGERQVARRDAAVTDGYKAAQNTAAQAGQFVLGHFQNDAPLRTQPAVDVRFTAGGAAATDGMTADDALAPGRTGTAWLDAARFSGFGLGGIEVYTGATFRVDGALTLADGGALKVVAPHIDVNASVTARAGSIRLGNVLARSGTFAETPLGIDGKAYATIGPDVTLDVRGKWVNALRDGSDAAALAFADGGTVDIGSTHDVTVARGAVVDASGGGAVLADGSLHGGRGGSVTLAANAPGASAAGMTPDPASTLHLDGDVRGYAAGAGGTLAVSAGTVRIGGASAAGPGELLLPASLFASGFGVYDINGFNALTVADGTRLDVTRPVYRLTDAARQAPTGTDPASAMARWLPPAYLEDAARGVLTQRAGADLTLRSAAYYDNAGGYLSGGRIDIGTGTVLQVDAGHAIRVDGKDRIRVDGTLVAPGGSIAVLNTRVPGGGKADPSPGDLAIVIDDHARLDVAARAATARDQYGRAYGVVPDGGAIVLGSEGGVVDDTRAPVSSDAFVIVRAGAVLDASGTSASLATGAVSNRLDPMFQAVYDAASGGGRIAVRSFSGFTLDGRMTAAAGGATARGGALTLELQSPLYRDTALPDAARVPRELLVSQHDQASTPYALGRGAISVDRIAAGRFDDLSLVSVDAVGFVGSVDLAMRQSLHVGAGWIDAASLAGAVVPDTHVTLSAPYVALDAAPRASTVTDSRAYPVVKPQLQRARAETDASLSVRASLIDLGTIDLAGMTGDVQLANGRQMAVARAGFGSVDFTSQGDIRLAGALRASRVLTLDAAQIYPVSSATASLFATERIALGRTTADAPAQPLAVFGSLTIQAPDVRQGAVLRAPLGKLQIGVGNVSEAIGDKPFVTDTVAFLPGSITSVSGAGLSLPYGGTTDGITYTYRKADGTTQEVRLADSAINVIGQHIDVQQGALLDLSGGGDLRGVAFVSGRGGSVDVLNTALANASPANTFSDAGNAVYAIVPSMQAAYAPVDAAARNAPGVGRQITVPSGVPGLPAGTYTLMPASYALMPGAFRVELGGTASLAQQGVLALRNGSYAVSAVQGVANGAVRDAQPTRVIVTGADTVRKYAQYNETGYADFAREQASTLGNPLAALPSDGHALNLKLGVPATPGDALTFDGRAVFDAASGGRNPGYVTVDATLATTPVEVRPAGTAATDGMASVTDRSLNALQAPRLVLGGTIVAEAANPGSFSINTMTRALNVREGSVVRAPEIIATAGVGGITIESGARLDTLGMGTATPFRSADGYVYRAGQANGVNALPVLALSNNWLDLRTESVSAQSGGIRIGAARLYTEGSLALMLQGAGTLTMDDALRFGARELSLSGSSINIGSAGALAAAARDNVLPAGLQFNQALLDRLLAGNDEPGVPALASLRLGASSAINFFGTVDVSAIDPATGKSRLGELILTTPAIYGRGEAGDVATLTAGKLIWSGVSDGVAYNTTTQPSSARPGAVLDGGAGMGRGTLNLVADDIVLGYASFAAPDSRLNLNHMILGFSTANLTAARSISANHRNTLSAWQAQGSYVPGQGYQYSGGNLNLNTPLLMGDAGSVTQYVAGGALTVAQQPGQQDAAAGAGARGAEIGLRGGTVTLASHVALPSGKLVATATGDITLTDAAQIDLAGRDKTYFDQTRATPGGDLVLESASGNVTQAAGSRIDVSAPLGAAAGTIQVTALGEGAGRVDLAGRIDGGAGDGVDPAASGAIDIRARVLADFGGLNRRLNDGVVFGARSFVVKQGDLVIGDELRAHAVTVSADGGSLTVNGKVDASGTSPGSIRLAARDNLTIAGGALLDAHATTLDVDGYGQPIDATNRATVALSAAGGTLTLAPGAHVDLRSADAVARGRLVLDAGRAGSATANDMRIEASGPITVDGAASIAVQGFWRYDNAPADPVPTLDGRTNQIVTQAYLDSLHQDSLAFIDGAQRNAGLLARLAGLRSYGAAYHLRPGVEIASRTANGNLTVSGDVDLSGYRYGPNATSVRGSGEPGALVLRAGGDLNIFGSITDGFAPPVATPDDANWKLAAGIEPSRGELVLPVAVTLRGATSGVVTSFTNVNGALGFDIPVRATGLKAGVEVPTRVALNAAATIPAGTTLRAAVRNPDGSVRFAAGTVIAQATSLARGSQLDAGTVLPVLLQVQAFTVPAGTPLSIFSGAASLAANVQVPSGTKLPPGINLQFANAAGTGTVASIDLRPTVAGSQGRLWAVAPMLAAGSDSWSMRLAGGADTASADTRTLQAPSGLGGAGSIRLSDYHYTSIRSTVRQPVFSVVRTGTGDLDMLAGGDVFQATPYGVYTAGTQAAGIGANGSDPFNLARGASNGSVLGAGVAAGYEALVGNGNYQAWYPQRGGDVRVAAQGDLRGDLIGTQNAGPLAGMVASNLIGNWLWRQGGDEIGQRTAWWINFGTYAQPYGVDAPGRNTQVIGFTGIGALGGGNVRVDVGGNAGVLSDRGNSEVLRSSGLNIVSGGSGRVVDGALVQTGGGRLDVRIGGAWNPGQTLSQGAGDLTNAPDLSGSVVNLRGNTVLAAASVGYVSGTGGTDPSDPRWQGTAPRLIDPTIGGGIYVAPGDGEVAVTTRGDLVLTGALDPGRARLASTTPFQAQGRAFAGGGYSWFSLWTDRSGLSLASSGGNVSPIQMQRGPASLSGGFDTDGGYLYPGALRVEAASGSIFYGKSDASETRALLLAPTRSGTLEMLAAGDIRARDFPVNVSGADPALLPTPFHPAFEARSGDSTVGIVTNVASSGGASVNARRNWLFTYQPNTYKAPGDDGARDPLRFYAVDGDVVGLRTGQIVSFGGNAVTPGDTWYVGSRPVWVQAGRDVVGAGTRPGQVAGSGLPGSAYTGNLFVHAAPHDISVVSAGRDIVQSSFNVAGPGLLEVRAGRNLYQADKGSIESLGAIVNVDPANRSGGASIVAMAGVGASGPDYGAFARRYFSAGNAADAAYGLDDPANAGRVARTYEKELAAWLAARYGEGGTGGAVERFLALSPAEQGIFVREVYFNELRASGREYTDASGRRAGSYLRGRQAIATLFPAQDGRGNAIAYDGDITLFGGSGIRTDFGGHVETLTPGGRTVIGVEGVVPPASSGLLTQGTGDIRMYSRDSILLGLSRIFTTFGGDITAWSATGDINAGRGAKTTVVFSPPRRLYDDVGNVTLSPTVPSTGAGIATLNPIPEIAPGDIDLIAPLGTIDAGEAGIRVSGNVNLAALQVVNAANIQVQGKATGLPAMASVNVGALTSASAAASAVNQAAEDLARQQTANAKERMPSVVSVQVLGFGEGGQ
ncbi:filamentous haemagglutinin family protein [Cupriavidus pauculus]|uniref:Filamentous hemagglutinin N-terminal domain-containing protein n=1 Tax=Cupriavidus pauculus TaxID=82633 RepID=A0A3G8H354_9BURK|nr:filamentous haemagglutinin family protein [Cupriavidus pauculus]AZG14834.1 filamentous hemagglutinin N-terminal domain-containing protein [Cupriavidus pauculus]